jgi:N6-adenosine-specific RNA methylase IME4
VKTPTKKKPARRAFKPSKKTAGQLVVGGRNIVKFDHKRHGRNALTRTEWAARIGCRWQDACAGMLEATFQIGRDLIEAKNELDHGEFIPMIENDLPFGKRSAQMFMAIAKDSKLAKANFNSLLPPSWQTLYKITRFDDEVFDRLIDDGTINRDCTYAEINKVLRMERVHADEQRVLSLRPRPGKFKTLLFDSAWDYGGQSLAGRAEPDYALQTLDQLRAMDITQWADDAGCHLYLCATNNFVLEAGKLVDHWGWRYHMLITWIKPSPFGLGSYFRNSTEHVLFATRGEMKTRPAAASIPTHFEAPRGDHSEKPEKLYEIIRAASYPPYGEGNQRQPRPDFVNLFESVELDAAE